MVAGRAGTFDASVNVSSFPQIHNASSGAEEDYLGYSCASIGGKRP